jgi:hypothetical protein
MPEVLLAQPGHAYRNGKSSYAGRLRRPPHHQPSLTHHSPAIGQEHSRDVLPCIYHWISLFTTYSTINLILERQKLLAHRT